VGPFLLAFQEKIQKFWQRILAVFSVAILSSVLAVSPASAQFLSDGVTPVTPIPSNAVFSDSHCRLCDRSAGHRSLPNIWGRLWIRRYGKLGYIQCHRYVLCLCERAKSFNADISGWNTSNVTDMSSLFIHKSSFNQNIGNWNTANVTNMSHMFYNAAAFNQNIGSWTTSGVTDMSFMFAGAVNFDQNINGWNTSNVTNMSAMFFRAAAFNQNLNSWNTSNVTDMSSMFESANAFNGDIKNWNTSNVTAFESMFSMPPPLIKTSEAGSPQVRQDMEATFQDASTFNQDLSQWNTANVTVMDGLFKNTLFNHDISGWNVSSVTDMIGVFQNSPFNHDISAWNVSNVQFFDEMFSGNTAFDQEIRGWTISNTASFVDMFNGATAFAATYSGATGFGTTPIAGFFTLSSDATLANLSVANSLTSINLTPGVTNYSTILPYQTSATITLTVNQFSSAEASYASATVDGTAVSLNSSGTGTHSVALAPPSNPGQTVHTVNIVVTAPDGTTLSYKLTIIRYSNDATLSALSLSSGSLSPSLSPSFATGIFSYTATVGNSVSSVNVIPIPN
jgi:surface protein